MSLRVPATAMVLLGVLVAGGAVALRPARSLALDLTYARVERQSPALALDSPNPSCGAVRAPIRTECAGLGSAIGATLKKAGKQLITGHAGGAVGTAVGGAAGAAVGGAAGAVASSAGSVLGLAALGAWVFGGGGALLQDTASALGQTTTPQLQSTWFSSTYWHMTAIASVLALPFLFAAAVQALIRSDVTLLARAALGYLPLAMLAIAVAAPLTTLLLSASDEMSALVSAAAAKQSTHFLVGAALSIAALSTADGSPFLALLVALFMIAATFALWVELLIREAAVYVVVLMLPLAFAAMVWPARRVWAVRAIEILVALVLSKFAIVAVLSLGGAAISSGAGHLGVSDVMAGAVLIALAAFSPWVLLRMVPLVELASGAAGALRGEMRSVGAEARNAAAIAREPDEWIQRATSWMRRSAEHRPPPDMTASDRPAHGGSNGTGHRPQPPAPQPSEPQPPAPQPSEPQPPAPQPQEPQSPAPQEPQPSQPQSSEPPPPGPQPSERGGTGGTAGAEDALTDDPGERLPGMAPMWQAEDLSWRPLPLGRDADWPSPSVWPNEDSE